MNRRQFLQGIVAVVATPEVKPPLMYASSRITKGFIMHVKPGVRSVHYVDTDGVIYTTVGHVSDHVRLHQAYLLEAIKAMTTGNPWRVYR